MVSYTPTCYSRNIYSTVYVKNYCIEMSDYKILLIDKNNYTLVQARGS
jgi:hypothetical protein